MSNVHPQPPLDPATASCRPRRCRSGRLHRGPGRATPSRSASSTATPSSATVDGGAAASTVGRRPALRRRHRQRTPALHGPGSAHWTCPSAVGSTSISATATTRSTLGGQPAAAGHQRRGRHRHRRLRARTPPARPSISPAPPRVDSPRASRTSTAAPAATRSPATPSVNVENGNGGNDTLTGGGGDDALDGGAGVNHARGRRRERHARVTGGSGDSSSAAPASTRSPAATATTTSSRPTAFADTITAARATTTPSSRTSAPTGRSTPSRTARTCAGHRPGDRRRRPTRHHDHGDPPARHRRARARAPRRSCRCSHRARRTSPTSRRRALDALLHPPAPLDGGQARRPVRVTCKEACGISVALSVDRTTARRLKLDARTSPVVIATARRNARGRRHERSCA